MIFGGLNCEIEAWPIVAARCRQKFELRNCSKDYAFTIPKPVCLDMRVANWDTAGSKLVFNSFGGMVAGANEGKRRSDSLDSEKRVGKVLLNVSLHAICKIDSSEMSEGEVFYV